MSESKELTLPERAAVALGTPKYEQEIHELVAKSVTITEVKNKDGREQCHGAMMTLKNARVAIEKAAKAAREDATAFSKAVIAEEKRLVALATPEETRLQALRDAWDEAEAAEKARKAAAEKARVDGIRSKIDAIRATPAKWIGKPSIEIRLAADSLSETVIDLEGWQEFAGEAMVERDHAVKQMREMQEKQAAHEAEAARLAEERAKLERERAEAAERERVAALARAEEERQAREAREREEARLRSEREAHDAELRRQREAEEARLAEQHREIERQQAEIAAARAEQERKEREAREAAEAEAKARAAAEKIEADHAEALAENARIDVERVAERERKIRAEREEKAKEATRLASLILAGDALTMLEDVLHLMAEPIGQECCGQPTTGGEYMGQREMVCCGNPEPVYHDIESLGNELNLWRNEMLRRLEQKAAA